MTRAFGSQPSTIFPRSVRRGGRAARLVFITLLLGPAPIRGQGLSPPVAPASWRMLPSVQGLTRPVWARWPSSQPVAPTSAALNSAPEGIEDGGSRIEDRETRGPEPTEKPYSSAPVPAPIRQCQGQRPAPNGEQEVPFTIQLTPPSSRQMFRRQSEEAVRRRIGRETSKLLGGKRALFPKELSALSRKASTGRHWTRLSEGVEPYSVCYGRLFFEEINSERYGWDLGVLQPLLSAGTFYSNIAALPCHLLNQPCRLFECSAGYCLPGDPVPLLLYPPGQQ